MGLGSILKGAARLVWRADPRANALHELRRRLGGEPELPNGPVRRVLVVCQGNICRSPFAAELLRRGEPQLEVESAGLSATPGRCADPSALALAPRWGVTLGGHRAQSVTSHNLDWADLVLGMEGCHTVELTRRWPGCSDKVRLLGHFLQQGPFHIADPWGENEGVFAARFEQIKRAVTHLLDRLGDENRQSAS